MTAYCTPEGKRGADQPISSDISLLTGGIGFEVLLAGLLVSIWNLTQLLWPSVYRQNRLVGKFTKKISSISR